MLSRYCLGSGLAMTEMKVLLAVVARQYRFTADTDTEWVHNISKVPKVGWAYILGLCLMVPNASRGCMPLSC